MRLIAIAKNTLVWSVLKGIAFLKQSGFKRSRLAAAAKEVYTKDFP